jgi:hypothetical protein
MTTLFRVRVRERVRVKVSPHVPAGMLLHDHLVFKERCIVHDGV